MNWTTVVHNEEGTVYAINTDSHSPTFVPQISGTYTFNGSTEYLAAGTPLTREMIQAAYERAVEQPSQRPDIALVNYTAYRDMVNYQSFDPSYIWQTPVDPIVELRKQKGFKKFHR